MTFVSEESVPKTQWHPHYFSPLSELHLLLSKVLSKNVTDFALLTQNSKSPFHLLSVTGSLNATDAPFS